MKNIIKYILQKILGLHNYLFLFARYVILKFPFDKKERSFLRFLDLIDKSEVVLDIGANIGVTTYYFSKKLPGFQVYSFEPIPDNLAILRRVVNKYNLKNIFIHPYALGNKNENVDMVMPEENKVFFHGLSHVKEPNNKSKGKLYDVEMKRLDDIVELNNVKIKAIKIDVEDYEYNVLKGGENLIKKNRPFIYCELWESKNRDKCFGFFDKLNYKTYIDQGRVFEEYPGKKESRNFFFIPVENCDKVKLK